MSFSTINEVTGIRMGHEEAKVLVEALLNFEAACSYHSKLIDAVARVISDAEHRARLHNGAIEVRVA